MAFFPGDSLVAVTSEASRVVLVVGFADGAVRRTLPTNGRGGHMLAMSSLGNRLLVGNIADATIAVIDPADTTKTRLIKVGRQPEGVAISPDGQAAWAGSNQDSIVVVIDLRSEQHVDTLRGFGLPYRIAVSADGKHAVVSDPDDEGARLFSIAHLADAKFPSRVQSAAITSLLSSASRRGAPPVSANMRRAVPLGPMLVASIQRSSGDQRGRWYMSCGASMACC